VKQYAEPVPSNIYPWTPSPIDKVRNSSKQEQKTTTLFFSAEAATAAAASQPC
jgi:hypothetical protein